MNIALITGATSGIGREFYRQIVKHYPRLDEVWCVGRDSRRLFSLPQKNRPRLRVFQLDLSREEDLKSLASSLSKRPDLRIKLLVNAAGTGRYGRVDATGISELTDTVRVNCEALTAVTRMCLFHMERGSRIIQMCSGAAFFPQPDFAVYSASKAFVLSFSQSLRQELKKRGITVTAVCPGPVDTPFLARSREGVTVPAYKKKAPASASAVVAKALLDARAGKAVSVYGFPMNLLYLGSRVLPREILTSVTDFLNHKGDTNEKN